MRLKKARITFKYKDEFLFIFLDSNLLIKQKILLVRYDKQNVGSALFTHLYILKILARIGFISNLKK